MDGFRDGRRDGRRDRYLYIIDCLRQVVAFAPKVIKCAYGAIKCAVFCFAKSPTWRRKIMPARPHPSGSATTAI